MLRCASPGARRSRRNLGRLRIRLVCRAWETEIDSRQVRFDEGDQIHLRDHMEPQALLLTGNSTS